MSCLASLVSTVGVMSWLAFGSFQGSIPGSITIFHQLSVTGERMSVEYWLTAKVSLPRKNVVRITDHPDMTLAVD